MSSFAAVFSGIGTQWERMGRELMESEPAFRAGFRAFDAAFTALSGWSAERWLHEEGGDVSPAFRGHPCILAVSFGLTELMLSRGYTPALCLGHSGGEVAAAWAAGAIDTGQAALIAFEHSKVLQAAGGTGAMLHCALPAEQLGELLKPYGDTIQIAAFNSPVASVCSGDRSILEALAAEVERRKPGAARFLRVDVPFHSAGIEPLLPSFTAGLATLRPSPARIPVVSSLHGGLADPAGGDFGAEYWRRHIHEPVRFAQAVATALDRGVRHFVEIAPHAVLQASLVECAATRGLTIHGAALMARNMDSRASAEAAFAVLSSWTGEGCGAQISEAGRAMRELERKDREIALRALVWRTICQLLPTLSPDKEDGQAAFQSLGLSSVLAMRLRASLAERLGLSLPVSAIFNHPSAHALAEHLAARLDADATGGNPDPAREESGIRTRGLRRGSEPVAVVGVACRFPGGITDMDSYWRFIAEGRDAVIPIPAERWDWKRHYDADRDAPGTMYTKEAAFLTSPIDTFDPLFFGISAKEALQLDPQQRLLLEMSWRAFEDAAINPEIWRGKPVGVFLGMTNNEYSHAHRESKRRERIDAYSLTGTTLSGACGRLSYFHGFEGPCWAVDTACSSGIVALHSACQSLRLGESDLALAGAATLMLTPDLHVCFTKLGAISPDGRSKAFDDGADGYGRGEGGAVVLLKRLSDAEAAGDRILGLIRGTAVNQDGRSNGLTAPNGLAQQKVITQALADARRAPLDISYVEAHGTGTALGDSIELDALAGAYCRDRAKDAPLRIGSVKANIGHLEPAAAMASLLKLLLCIRHRAIPANIHVKTPNTRFDFAANAVALPTNLEPWESHAPRCAGMSAFGFSGVNGHVIVEEYVPNGRAPLEPIPGDGWKPEAFFLPLSAKTPEALKALAEETSTHVRRLSPEDLGAFCRLMATTRPLFPLRLAGVGADAAGLAAALDAAEIAPARTERGELALLFTGQGSQYPDMGRALYETYPVFREALDECAVILAGHGCDLKRLLFGGASAEDLADTANAQPLIAAVSHATRRLWESLGLRFAAVAGHSIGEYPAAVAAGIMSLEDMLGLAVARGRAMQEAPDGGMLAVFASEDRVRGLLRDHPDLVVATLNAPENTVVSGPRAALDRLTPALEAMGVSAKRLHVSKPFHSPAMRGPAAAFARALEGVRLHAPARMRFVSTLTGEAGAATDAEVQRPEYWVRQIVEPVRFQAAVATLAGLGPLAVEAGPSAALSTLVSQSGVRLRAIPTLAPRQNALQSLFAAAGHLFRAGAPLDMEALFAPFPRKHVPAPGYPFQKERYWMPIENEPLQALERHASGAGERQSSPAFGAAAVFQSRFSAAWPGFVQEHVIFDKAISPAAGHMAMLLAAARELWGDIPCELRDVDFLAPLIVDAEEPRLVQIIVDDPALETSPFRIVSSGLGESGALPAGDSAWRTHCTGLISRAVSPRPVPPATTLDTSAPLAREEFYQRFVSRGYVVGPRFQRIEEIAIAGDEARCRVTIRDGHPEEKGHVIHPGSLDSVLQTILPPHLVELADTMMEEGALLIPMHVERLTLWGPVPHVARCASYARKSPRDAVLEGKTLACDQAGAPVLELSGCLFRMTDHATLYKSLHADPAELLYVLRWTSEPLPSPAKSAKPAGASAPLAVLPLGDGQLARRIAPMLDACLLPPDADLAQAAARTGATAEGLEQAGPLQLLLVHSGAGDDLERLAAREMDDCARLLAILRDTASSSLPVHPSLVTSGLAGDLGLGRIGERGAAEGDSANPQAPRPHGLAGASLPGLAAVFGLEHPGLLRDVIDLAPDPEADDLKALAILCGSGTDAPEVRQWAVRNGNLHACRLARTERAETPRRAVVRGTHLITGGTGALGLRTALRLAEQGAEAVALLSRSGRLDAQGQRTVEDIRAKGCRVLLPKGDVANAADVQAVLEALRRDAPPLRGVFHAAGLLDDGVLAGLTEERLRKVMAPKIAGALLLHRLTLADPLDFFVCYSSAGTLLGSQGQANYNAANHFLNAFSRWRAGLGLPAASPCFGPWADGGMAMATERRGENLRQTGILEVDGAAALEAMFLGLQRGHAAYGVMAVDWGRFSSRRALDPQGFFSLLPIGRAPMEDRAADSAAALLTSAMTGASGKPDREKLAQGLQGIAARTLGIGDPARIALNKPLLDYGFDSLMAVEFRTAVSKALNTPVPVSIVFEFPTLDKIAEWLIERAADDARPSQASPRPAAEQGGAVRMAGADAGVRDLLADIDSLLDDGPDTADDRQGSDGLHGQPAGARQ